MGLYLLLRGNKLDARKYVNTFSGKGVSMIGKNIKMSECVGKYATLDRSVMNGAGQCINKGSRVKIIDYGRALDIQTDKCPCCGQYCRIYGITKDSLTLIEENDIVAMISKQHIEEAKHAIGLDYKNPYKRHGKLFYKPYRNNFATNNTDKIWTELAANGYAEHDEPNERGMIYRLTNKGLEWLGNELGIKIYPL